MRVLRRASLVAFALAAPPAAAALLYAATTGLLHATHRIIDPQVLRYAAAIEVPVFFFFAVLEAKDRW
jgi:hypothetical protein